MKHQTMNSVDTGEDLPFRLITGIMFAFLNALWCKYVSDGVLSCLECFSKVFFLPR